MTKDHRAKFEEIVDQNKARILRICKSYGQTPEDREDMFQEVALNIWKSLPSFHGEAKVDTWIYRITLNVCMRYAFKLNSKKKKEKEKAEEEPEQLEVFANPDGDSDYDDSIENLYCCINELNEIDRTIAFLFLDDLAYKEIASITGLTENNVAVRMNRIKQKLTKCFKEKGHA